ncbi:MAG: hypothetical protein ABIO36_01255 [Pyrinomonadaceae bacterium]
MADEPRSVNPRLWGLMMSFGGILIAMTGKMGDIRWLTFAGVFLSIAGMFFVAAYPMLRSLLPRKRPAAHAAQPEFLSPVGTTKKLSPVDGSTFIPSVTENTTNLLHDRAQDPVKVPH